MRLLKYVFLALALFCFVSAASSCSVNKQFVSAVDSAWSVIGPEYETYVKADPNLAESSKATRLRTAKILTETIEEAKKK